MYLGAFLSGLAAYGAAEVEVGLGSSVAVVAAVELGVAGALLAARRGIEHVGVAPAVMVGGWGWLDGYAAAKSAFEGRIAEAAWARHVE